MKKRYFFIGTFVLGVTVGSIHGLSLSPASAAVLQIIGTIAAAAVGLVVGSEKDYSDAVEMKQILPSITAIIFTVIGGYWIGWTGVKTWRIYDYALPTYFAEYSAGQRVDAYRLVSIGRALGVPRHATLERASELLENHSTDTRLTPLEELLVIHLAATEAGNCKSGFNGSSALLLSLEALSDLLENANVMVLKFDSGNFKKSQVLLLRLDARALPLPDAVEGFADLLAKAGCRTSKRDLRRIRALDFSLRGSVSNLQEEIERLLKSAPELSEVVLQGPRIENETLP